MNRKKRDIIKSTKNDLAFAHNSQVSFVLKFLCRFIVLNHTLSNAK